MVPNQEVVRGEPTEAALAQLRESDYTAMYRGAGGAIHLIGIEFSRETRNFMACEKAPG